MFRPTSAIFLFDEELINDNIEILNYDTSNILQCNIKNQNF